MGPLKMEVTPKRIWVIAKSVLCDGEEHTTDEIAEVAKCFAPWNPVAVATYWRRVRNTKENPNMVPPDDQVFRGYMLLISYCLSNKAVMGLVTKRKPPGTKRNYWRITEKGRYWVA
jgi:hypothetical protein